MKLSILVPSVHTRFDGYARNIQTSLYRQLDSLPDTSQDEVEILVLTDNKKRTIGAKRNDMIAMAQGDYVVFVDDDDRIEPDYVRTLLHATESGADVITFVVSVRLDGDIPKKCYYGLEVRRDENRADAYFRMPNHLMCVKRDLAIRTGFSDMQKGEDSAYAKRLRPLLSTEHSIYRVLYHYDFNSQTTETQR